MKVALSTLNTLLQSNVLEIKFTRRKPKPGAPNTRRMLCTNSQSLLNSSEGRRVLGYTPTKQPPKFNPATKNLAIVWDLFKRGFRMVNADSCELISTIPADDEFWLYWAQEVSKMTTNEVNTFYDI